MSYCLNEVNLMGYLGDEPEIHSEKGDFATVSLALNKNWKDKKTGEIQTHTTWVSLLLNGQAAVFVSEYLGKGSRVHIKGELRENKWKDENSQLHSTLQVKVLSIIPLDKLDTENDQNDVEQKNDKKPYSKISKRNFYKKNFAAD